MCVSYTSIKKKGTLSVLTFCFHPAIQMHFQKQNKFLDEWDMDRNPSIIETYKATKQVNNQIIIIFRIHTTKVVIP